MTGLKAIAAAAALLAAAPAAAQTELIYNSYLPPFNETFQVGIRDFARRIEEESGGTIKVTIPDASLAPSDRQYEMVLDGIADMALLNISSVSQFVTLNRIGELPGHAPTAEAGSVALWETYQRYFAPLHQFEGVVVLSTHVLPGRQILSVGSRAPKRAEDLQGAKIWATSRPLIAAAEDLGGVPMVIQFGELQEFVSKGNLDLLFISAASAEAAGVLQDVTHVTKVPGGLGTISFVIIISEQRWNELTEEQQAAILRAAEDLPRRLGQANDASEAEVADAVARIPTTELDPETRGGLGPILDRQIDAWKAEATTAGIENPDEVLAFYRSVLERETAD
ncbi:TRAP-type C4-dicarboxylate transport system, periplasmic component [Rubellimicrobium thermophilum DSM 16684]|uniref:TRAP-type C4-dicarboxylate transport system, periplasmic component n=1 Tax=Rubellimicrobium thermophilum DSM 16684 TaxID=1123069 RepID=S9RXY4_9RHOB|nr:TRAP transporter substrate-binding protein DctP [Rubellimicrobium thermophilum]EPX82895.1 TRAP-type C4-dicarboxylate transport system, periplasmic component [Rubellimicrobium thermophilum DSM 16684]